MIQQRLQQIQHSISSPLAHSAVTTPLENMNQASKSATNDNGQTITTTVTNTSQNPLPSRKLEATATENHIQRNSSNSVQQPQLSNSSALAHSTATTSLENNSQWPIAAENKMATTMPWPNIPTVDIIPFNSDNDDKEEAVGFSEPQTQFQRPSVIQQQQQAVSTTSRASKSIENYPAEYRPTNRLQKELKHRKIFPEFEQLPEDNNQNITYDGRCNICKKRRINTLAWPCCHMSTCFTCVNGPNDKPVCCICKQKVKYYKKVYGMKNCDLVHASTQTDY